MKNNRGFSLLELLIVVAIILIIATIAIPSLLRSRQSAQEFLDLIDFRELAVRFDLTYLQASEPVLIVPAAACGNEHEGQYRGGHHH